MIHTQGAKRSVPSHLPPSLSECRPQVLHPLPEESRDHACNHSDYAQNLSQNPNTLSRLDLELHMLRERDTDKVKRSENKVCIPYYSYPIPPSRFCLLLARSFPVVFASRPCRLMYNPVLWFPSQRPPGFTLSAEKATFTLCRRDRGDGGTAAKQHLSRKRWSLRARPWSNARLSAHQTRRNHFVVKATVHGYSHSKTPR